MHAFVDADHAGNHIMWHSHTGILIYLNCAPILWFSKVQNTMKSSMFGSKFVPMCILVEMVESLRYTLWMFSIPIDGPTHVFCDNKSVITNATIPTSTWKRTQLYRLPLCSWGNCIWYFAFCKLHIVKVHTTKTLADFLTNQTFIRAPIEAFNSRISW